MNVVGTIEITGAVLVTGRGPDKVYLQTRLPPCIWPFSVPPTVTLEIAAGQGEVYLKSNFPDLNFHIV